ncbi:MAG: class I SAM-dependent methyltransferase [Opitutaceae bacterium]|nr:class I SAM-dependent methyltransferase [Opitutaceae bacterium]
MPSQDRESRVTNAYRSIYQSLISTPRAGRLAGQLGVWVPRGASVLDVGCGDGLIDSLILAARPDLSLSGIDVLVRPVSHIPVQAFDGHSIPLPAGAVDIVMFIDVLHHTDDPTALLAEGRRVARQGILLKDHLTDPFLAWPTLRLMDFAGNVQHGVALPYHYWSRAQWQEAFGRLGLRTANWTESVDLYPALVSWLFGRGLHFVALLVPEAA